MTTQIEQQRSPKSTFKNALKTIPVPIALTDGVDVMRVYANGKTKKCFLTLSDDNFTLYVTSDKYKKSKGFFRRKTEDKDERAIDIGAIDRIQRGHATHKFELARKHRQDSQRSLLSIASPKIREEEQEEALGLINPERCFSIIFRGDWTFDLMASPDVNRDEILDTLDRIIQTYQEQKVKVSNDVLMLRYVWLEADKDKSNTINPTELGRVLDRINFHMKKSQLNVLYEKFGKTIGLDRKMRRQGLSFEQCCTLLHKIKRDSWMVKPVNQIWNKLFGEFMKNGKPRMTVSDKTFLDKFMHRSQGETNATIDDVRELFARLNELEMPHVADGEPKDPTRIDKNRFEAFLLSKENDAFDPARERFDRRTMNKPVSEYWINSSHNTYLTGHQFTSYSSVEMYSSALYRGCKCLELDIWDGDTDQFGRPVPVVWHGHTMTSKILFIDIIKTIKLFMNFHPDTFPIILSFENHCSIAYQEVIAEQLVRILGDTLYVPAESTLYSVLPSPWALRGMVVIKGRRPNVDAGVDDPDDESDEEGAQSIIFSDDNTKSSSYSNQSSVHHGIAPQLARITLFHGTKLKNLDESIRNPTHHMHSFSESKVRAMCRKKDGRKWAIYNQSHMTRTYPAGSRVDSSNYLPILPWSVGCQLVALNFQTADAALRLNDGRFRENAGCGYVLKPSALLQSFEQHTEEAQVPLKLSIRVLSGACLPKPKEQKAGECIDPYVKISVFDVKNGDKEVVSNFSSAVIYNNGFFPIWNEDKFIFTVENWAVAMIQLTIYDKDVGTDDFVATASIPISCLRKGLRSVKLFDAGNTRSGAFDFASLLIDVKTEKAMVEI